MIYIKHNSDEQNWNEVPEIMEIIENAKTLVLGSFNPYNPNGNNTDFYYGRCSNYFWKVIAEMEGEDENHYCDNLDRKIESMRKYSFCFLDLIESLEVSSEKLDLKIVEDFVQNKIYKGYSDIVLFTSKTKYKNQKIIIKRNYNPQVLEVLNNSKINVVIHTLGNNRITKEFITKPSEKAHGDDGFQGFIKLIRNSLKSDSLIAHSFSPSAYAVRRLGENYYAELKTWMKSYLINK